MVFNKSEVNELFHGEKDRIAGVHEFQQEINVGIEILHCRIHQTGKRTGDLCLARGLETVLRQHQRE